MNLPNIFKKSKEEKISIEPSLKELFNLEFWALKNNFFVHPLYLKAVETKEKILVWASLIIGVFLSIFIQKLFYYLR